MEDAPYRLVCMVIPLISKFNLLWQDALSDPEMCDQVGPSGLNRCVIIVPSVCGIYINCAVSRYQPIRNVKSVEKSDWGSAYFFVLSSE